MYTFRFSYSFFFFFNDTATPEIYPLPLHDPLPISSAAAGGAADRGGRDRRDTGDVPAAAALTFASSRRVRLPPPEARTTARPNRLTGNRVEQPGQQRWPVQPAEQRSGIRGAVEEPREPPVA